MTGPNAEAGLKSYFFNRKLSLNLSFYHIVANNATMPDPLHPDYSIQTGQVISNGIDFDMTGNITPAFVINANYAFANAKITKGDSDLVGQKNIGTPDHYCNLWIKYKLLKGRFKGLLFSLGYQYMGRRGALQYGAPGSGNIYLPVYNLLDAAISYRNDKFNISLNVYNITNINYATLGYFNASANEWRYTPGEPVNFRLNLGINLRSGKKDR